VVKFNCFSTWVFSNKQVRILNRIFCKEATMYSEKLSFIYVAKDVQLKHSLLIALQSEPQFNTLLHWQWHCFVGIVDLLPPHFTTLSLTKGHKIAGYSMQCSTPKCPFCWFRCADAQDSWIQQQVKGMHKQVVIKACNTSLLLWWYSVKLFGKSNFLFFQSVHAATSHPWLYQS